MCGSPGKIVNGSLIFDTGYINLKNRFPTSLNHKNAKMQCTSLVNLDSVLDLRKSFIDLLFPKGVKSILENTK